MNVRRTAQRNLLAGIALVLAFVLLLGLTASASAQTTGTLSWTPPTERENGDPMPPEEIGGYELRVVAPDGSTDTIVINDPAATGYDLSGLQHGDYTFMIAVYDTNGLYSEFVEITADVTTVRPAPPVDLRFEQGKVDPAALCASDPQCRVDVLSARYGVVD